MKVVGGDVEYIAGLDRMSRSIALGLAVAFDDEDLMFIIMLMEWRMTTWLHDEVAKGEIGSVVCSTNHDLHGDVLDAVHFDRCCFLRICMPDKHGASSGVLSSRFEENHYLIL